MPPKIPMCVRDEKEDALRKMQVPPTSDNMGSLREHVQKKETTANGDTCAQARMRMTCLRPGNSTLRDSFPTVCTNQLTGWATCKPVLAYVPNCFVGCSDLRCTLPCHVLREYPAQLLGNEYQNPGKHAVYPPPDSVGLIRGVVAQN